MPNSYWRPAKIGFDKTYLGKEFETKKECEDWIKKNLWKIEDDKEDYDKWYSQSVLVAKYDENSHIQGLWRFQ